MTESLKKTGPTQKKPLPEVENRPTVHGPFSETGVPIVLDSIATDIWQEIRRILIEQENAYQRGCEGEAFSSIWAHSARVACIAHHIATLEGWQQEPALLAGLLHDSGKFVQGRYHENDAPEEEHAVRIARKVLMGSAYEKWLPTITGAILSTFLEAEATNDIGRAVYDADCLDKLGHMGAAQFFVKRALRRQFLDNALLIRAGTELTYARHAPDTLMTATGRSMARIRAARTRRFYKELLEEWTEAGIGVFTLQKEEIAGIACDLVVPAACRCGGLLTVDSDILDSLKCRSAVITYHCPACGFESEFSFCLPNIEGLPRRR
ncbi:HDOD domain-containing protein [Desulfosarcina widdelii]|nr:HDOD domain-containing protein [Desulfosarcina widdelii]